MMIRLETAEGVIGYDDSETEIWYYFNESLTKGERL